MIPPRYIPDYTICEDDDFGPDRYLEYWPNGEEEPETEEKGENDV